MSDLRYTKPAVGTDVEVHFRGRVVSGDEPGHSSFITVESESGFSHKVCYYHTGDMTVKKSLPKGYPPQAGDVWKRPGGLEYFVGNNIIFTKHTDDKGFCSYPLENLTKAIEEMHEKYELVHRSGNETG